MRALRLRDEQEAGCLLIQPMDDTRARLVSVWGTHVAATEQRVHQSAGPVTRSGMHHHTGRLVDDEQRLVLVYDRDIYLLWQNLTLWSGRQYHRDRLSS